MATRARKKTVEAEPDKKAAPKKSASRKPAGRAATKAPTKASGSKSGDRSDTASTRPPGKRPVWSGQLRLSLVSVPVQLFSATKTGARLSFHQIHEPSGKRIRYEKVVPGIGPVRSEDIAKGYDIGDGRYVIFDPEEIDAAKVEARRTLELVQFVDHCEIDPIWYERPYYVVPDGELAQDAFRVLRDAMRSTAKVGLGQFVLRGREYVGALRPCGDGMLLETLRFADEVEKAAPFFAVVEDEEAEEDLLDLATELIRRKSRRFEAAAFVDQYTQTLRELIDAKIRHRKTTAVEEGESAPRGGDNVVDLVEALRRSVRQAEGAGGGQEGGGSAPARRKRRAG